MTPPPRRESHPEPLPDAGEDLFERLLAGRGSPGHPAAASAWRHEGRDAFERLLAGRIEAGDVRLDPPRNVPSRNLALPPRLAPAAPDPSVDPSTDPAGRDAFGAGVGLMQVGRYAQATDLFCTLLDRPAWRAAAAGGWVQALFCDGRPADAMRAARNLESRLAGEAPLRLVALRYWGGRAAERLGELATASRLYGGVAEHEPDFEDVRARRTVLARMGIP